VDLLGGDLLGGLSPMAAPAPSINNVNGITDLFSLEGEAAPVGYSPPKQVWLSAQKGKGLEIEGTFSRKQGQMFMELTFTNRAMQPMAGFAIQFNKNSFGIAPAVLQVQSPLPPNQSSSTSLALNCAGPVQKMDPLNNLQVAVKNNIDVFYFSCQIPVHILFTEEGKMERKLFLQTWKEIPPSNEVQSNVETKGFNSDGIQKVLEANNIFTIAHRTVEGKDMLYQSLAFPNNVSVLAELKIMPGNPIVQLSLKTHSTEVIPTVQGTFTALLQ